MVALVDGAPKQLQLRDFLRHFLDFRCGRPVLWAGGLPSLGLRAASAVGCWCCRPPVRCGVQVRAANAVGQWAATAGCHC